MISRPNFLDEHMRMSCFAHNGGLAVGGQRDWVALDGVSDGACANQLLPLLRELRQRRLWRRKHNCGLEVIVALRRLRGPNFGQL
jgi:hypothetical protein